MVIYCGIELGSNLKKQELLITVGINCCGSTETAFHASTPGNHASSSGHDVPARNASCDCPWYSSTAAHRGDMG